MKSIFNRINSIFILLLFLSFKNISSNIDFTYPSAISLLNGNIFVVEKDGIFIYDKTLENILHSYFFKEDEKINDLDKLSNIIIKYKNNFIICLINLKIYFFNSEGELLLRTGKLITEEHFSYPTLSPIDLNDDNFYYYVIGYYSYESNLYQLKLKYYKISLSDNSNEKISELTKEKFTSSFWNNIREFENMGLSCEYMQSESNVLHNYLTCFFIINVDNSFTLGHYFFEVSKTSFKVSTNYYYAYIDYMDEVKQIKVITI